MARFLYSGIDQVVEEMKRLGLMSSPLVDDMLEAGGKEMVEARKDVINRYGLVESKSMRDHEKHDKRPTRVTGAAFTDVYSRGKDKKGVRNAEKEFIQHYGRDGSKPITATHFVDVADKEGAAKADAAMIGVFDAYLEKGD